MRSLASGVINPSDIWLIVNRLNREPLVECSFDIPQRLPNLGRIEPKARFAALQTTLTPNGSFLEALARYVPCPAPQLLQPFSLNLALTANTVFMTRSSHFATEAAFAKTNWPIVRIDFCRNSNIMFGFTRSVN
jgi:hypothetical protein